MNVLNRSIIIVSPKKPFIEWVNSLEILSDIYSVDLYRDDGGAYMVSDISNYQEFKHIVEKNHRLFFERELNGIIQDRGYWPSEISLELFYAWFEVHYHTVIADISNEPLLYDDT